jgi:Homeodomain-like domain
VDLRVRVIGDISAGASRREAAERYGVSPSVVMLWAQRFEQIESVAAPHALGAGERRAPRPGSATDRRHCSHPDSGLHHHYVRDIIFGKDRSGSQAKTFRTKPRMCHCKRSFKNLLRVGSSEDRIEE